MTLLARPYQQEAVDLAEGMIDGGLDPITSMPTGTGKALCLAFLAHRVAEKSGKRVLIMTHRGELLDQIDDKLSKIDPDHPSGREQAGSHADRRGTKPRYVLAMVQSVSRTDRLHDFTPKDFALVITDEGHHGHAKTHQKVQKHFRDNKHCRFAGFSATWVNAQGEGNGLACGYNAVAYRMKLLDAIRQGWILRPRSWPIRVTGIDWGSVKQTAEGIYDEKALDELLAGEKPFHQLTLAVRERSGDMPTLVYGPGKKWVKAAYGVFQRYEGANVRQITDDVKDDEERKAVFTDFRAGLYRKLVNCGILTEGTDLPNARVAAICRPCQSESLLAQIVGRVLRPLDGLLDHPDRRDVLYHDAGERLKAIAASAKPHSLVLDFSSRGARKLLTTADILGSDLPQPVLDYAQRIQNEEEPPDGGFDAEVVLERAEAEWALIQEEVERRSRIKAVGVKYETREVDMFDPRCNAEPERVATKAQAALATPKQVATIVGQLGWDENKVKHMSVHQASGIISKIKSGKIKRKEMAY